MSPVYRMAIARMLSLFSEGSTESGSLMGSVALFGAVAPTTMPSRRPTPAKLTATLGSDSLLQASLRITVLMTRSIGPLGASRWAGTGAGGSPTAVAVDAGSLAASSGPGGPGGWTDA